MAGAAIENQPGNIKIHDDIELAFIGNIFALLIAAGGLLGGSMFTEKSFDYWRQDVVPVIISVIILYRIFKNCLDMLRIYLLKEPDIPARASAGGSTDSVVTKERIEQEHAAIAQLPNAMSMSPEKVVEEVVKRIEAQKAEAKRKNR